MPGKSFKRASRLRQVVIVIALLLAGGGYLIESGLSGIGGPRPSPGVDAIASAYEARRGDVQVEAAGTVVRMLRDDTDGSRHQRFVLRLANGQRLLVAHNIDLAPRVDDLRVGDTVAFFGEYEYNDKGGVIHWTHHDPAGRHVGGWLRHDGRTYQ